MGAVSGDVNGLRLDCVNAADLTSRPTAGLRNGDRAYVADRVGTAEGPHFYLDKTSTATPATGKGVIATDSGVGRWLSEALFGGCCDDPIINQFEQPALYGTTNVTISNNNYTPGTVLQVPGGGYYEVVDNNDNGSYSLRNLGGTGTAAPGVTVNESTVNVVEGPEGVQPGEVAVDYVHPAVGASVTIDLAPATGEWIRQDMVVYTPGGGYYIVDSVGVNQASLTNYGATGSAAPLTVISAGTLVYPFEQVKPGPIIGESDVPLTPQAVVYGAMFRNAAAAVLTDNGAAADIVGYTGTANPCPNVTPNDALGTLTIDTPVPGALGVYDTYFSGELRHAAGAAITGEIWLDNLGEILGTRRRFTLAIGATLSLHIPVPRMLDQGGAVKARFQGITAGGGTFTIPSGMLSITRNNAQI